MNRAISNKSALIGISIAILAISFGVPTILGVLTASTTIGSSGSIKAIGVGIYWDGACTNIASSIDWGVIEAGYSKEVTIYVKNSGNSDVTLSLSTDNWNPTEATDHLALDWNYGGQSLSADEVLQIKLNLSADAGTTGITDFSVDVIIGGIG